MNWNLSDTLQSRYTATVELGLSMLNGARTKIGTHRAAVAKVRGEVSDSSNTLNATGVLVLVEQQPEPHIEQ